MSLRPVFGTLDRAEIDALLARHHVARIAYAHRDRVDLEPIHIVCRDGWLYLRTQPGTKLGTLRHNPWVAVEIDEVHGLFDWASVVMRGRLALLEDGPHDDARARYATAVAALRTLVPEAFTPNDPTPDRTVIGALYLDEVEGRRATSASAGAGS
jgi:nitroimidazol reductase NimA-like FMN-containing flavoprotein (pyridoxamine 5'-phosphate oxidase superfamily)